MSKIIALYGGAFKPPTGGHSQVVEEFLNQNSGIDGLIIFVGEKGRDGVTQDQSLKVWEIYLKHLPKIVQLHPCKAPIGDIIRFLKTHPEDKLIWVLGAREGKDDDLTDIDNRTSRFKDKYPNLTIKVITTKKSNMSGTNARKSLKQSKEELVPYLPKYLSKEEEEEIWGLLSQSEEPIEEDITKSELAKNIMRKKDFKTTPTVLPLNENATYSEKIDYKQNIKEITRVILAKHPNINQFPKLILKHKDVNNAQNFLGKTAHYDPNTKTIVLYTEGRHPKDIMKSYTHELQHFIQDMEGRLGNIQTTNTNEDEHLLSLEKEAYLEGNINFRKWTDSLQEIQEPALESDINPKELEMGVEIEMEHTDDVEESKVIALQHLAEDPKYYTKLKSLNLEENKKDPFGLIKFVNEISEDLKKEVKGVITPKYLIYSDMDGVIVDFDAQFIKYSKGLTPSEYETKYGAQEFWDLIDNKGGKEFWETMPWMEDGKKYWDYIKYHKPIILSAPSRNPTSREGKKAWVSKNLPGVKLELEFAYNKKKFADNNSILIDDRKKNIDDWENSGGIGIFYTSLKDTIIQLKKLGI